MSHRSWFPYILIGLSLALLALIVVVYRTNDDGETFVMPMVVPTAPTAAEYEDTVHGILATYDADGNAQAAYDALMATTVPTIDYQVAHLELVIAFVELYTGNTDEGAARLDLARATHVWLR